MPDFLQALQNGSHNLWLFIPTAILLGALHGLEPGHSKTMMAAFIIAIRGTVWQAVLLGLSAAISHSLLIWILAAAALHFGSQWNAETVEPYLQIGSAVCILALALWMFLRTRRDLRDAHAHQHGHGNHHHHHEHGHSHGEHDHHDGEEPHGHHHHHDERVLVPTGHGNLELSIFEKDCPPVFRIAFTDSHRMAASELTVETERTAGARQIFSFVAKGDFLESSEAIPEPHEFDAVLTFTHSGHSHSARVLFREGHCPRLAGEPKDFEDAHERAHAEDIERRFAGRTVTTPQIVVFGITGGLMPCPAAFTVLLVCLQLKRAALGFVMVGAFSLGLALTMVATGTIAALSVRHAQRRFRGFGEAMRRAPYISCVLLVLLAAYMLWQGWRGLAGH